MSHKTSEKNQKFCNSLSAGGSGIYLGIPDSLGHPDQLPCGKGLLCVHLPAAGVYTGQLYQAVYGHIDPELPADVHEHTDHRDLSCILSAFYVLSASYCLSRLKFKMRKPYMNMAMILGLFPSFMSMIAVYFILKAVGLTEGSLIRLA